jgi:uridine kinase
MISAGRTPETGAGGPVTLKEANNPRSAVRGDIIIIEDHHRSAASVIADHLKPLIAAKDGRYTITVAGESGAGKSETAAALAEALAERGSTTGVLQQDDYFIHPPRTNHETRVADIDWIGTNEVRLDLLDDHLAAAVAGEASVEKPLVIYEEDAITKEIMSLTGLNVVIAEGTYTTLLNNADTRVFIARNRLETMAARRQRGREEMDPFIERVLEIEHEIIAPHRQRADIIITRDYEVEILG